MEGEASLKPTAIRAFVLIARRRDKGEAETEIGVMSPRRTVSRTLRTWRMRRRHGPGRSTVVAVKQ